MSNQKISHTFHRCASHYEQEAIIPREIGERLFERLMYLTIKPKYILDLGCGPGAFSLLLKKQYPDAVVVSLDVVPAMLALTKSKQTWRKRWPLVCADMHAMPFADGVFDLVFANQVLPWSLSLSGVLSEISRVMNRDACLMFSMLGLDTFRELYASAVEKPLAVACQFMDMHHVGDALLTEKFIDPVVDMEMLVAHHRNWLSLLKALRAEGIRNVNPHRQRGLMGKRTWRDVEQFISNNSTHDGKFPLTYEVVYGHAWKGNQRRMEQGTETYIPVSSLRTRR
jgi:malonyl-CoA O-methyltransferase